jgi:hypothetical protein
MNARKRPRPRTASKTSPARIAAAQRAARALELRSTGATFAEIARRLGYSSKTGAHDAVKRGLDATLRKPADTLRTLDLERLDRLFATHFPRACRGDHQATAACLRIMERQAALLGLDAPVRTTGRLEHAALGGVLVVPTLEAGTAPAVSRGRLSRGRLG